MSDKRKGKFIGNYGGKNEAKRKKMDISHGSKGVIVTPSVPGKSREAVREFLFIVRKFLSEEEAGEKQGDPEVDVGTKSGDEEAEQTTITGADATSSAADDVTAVVQSEIADLKAETKRFVPRPDIFKSASFIFFHEPNDVPSRIVRDILWRTKKNSDFHSRFICRLCPIDFSCKPHMDDFLALARKVIAEKMPRSKAALETCDGSDGSEAKIKNWCVEYQSRHSMNTMPRQAVYDVITELVGTQNYKVNLNHAEVTVVVDVSPLICGLSVIEDYQALHRFNFHRLSHPEEEAAIEAARQVQLDRNKLEKVAAAVAKSPEGKASGEAIEGKSTPQSIGSTQHPAATTAGAQVPPASQGGNAI